MGDTSERSKPPSLPPRCPCGFWGVLTLCFVSSSLFVCFPVSYLHLSPLPLSPPLTPDIQKKQPGEDCTSRPIQSSGSSQSAVFSSETSSSSSQSLLSSPASSSEQPSAEEPSPTFPSRREGKKGQPTTGRSSSSESEATPEKRPRPDEKEGSGEEAGGTPKQKNRRRCYRCQTKLELVQQELGSCRCGYVFCMLHRLPEQHDCLFDHLGRGREEAVLKMVKLDRKVGRSCQRIGEECS
uniref:Zinc finger AN1-type containing 3 n=1 Tax=Seriola dumerili TaxID=41447 RepID=A0A3B4UPR3_SERDU